MDETLSHVSCCINDAPVCCKLFTLLMTLSCTNSNYLDRSNEQASPSHRRGVGQHPHRGFETVTIAFQGEVEHGDSVGNRGVIGTGDVQWMTVRCSVDDGEMFSG